MGYDTHRNWRLDGQHNGDVSLPEICEEWEWLSKKAS